MPSRLMVNFLQDLAQFATRPINSILRQWQQQGGLQGSTVGQVRSMEATYIQVARMPQFTVDGFLNYFTE